MIDAAGVLELRACVAATKVDDSVAEYMVAIGRATRTMPEVQYGASVRGALGLLHASKAVAAFAGREYVTPDDVKSVAASVLRHRIVLKPEAELDGLRPTTSSNASSAASRSRGERKHSSGSPFAPSGGVERRLPLQRAEVRRYASAQSCSVLARFNQLPEGEAR